MHRASLPFPAPDPLCCAARMSEPGARPETGAADRAKQRNEKRALIHARLLAQIDNRDAVDRDGLRVGEAEGLEGVANDDERRGRPDPWSGCRERTKPRPGHSRTTSLSRWIKAVRGVRIRARPRTAAKRGFVDAASSHRDGPTRLSSSDTFARSTMRGRVASRSNAGIRNLVGLAGEMRFQRALLQTSAAWRTSRISVEGNDRVGISMGLGNCFKGRQFEQLRRSFGPCDGI